MIQKSTKRKAHHSDWDIYQLLKIFLGKGSIYGKGNNPTNGHCKRIKLPNMQYHSEQQSK